MTTQHTIWISNSAAPPRECGMYECHMRNMPNYLQVLQIGRALCDECHSLDLVMELPQWDGWRGVFYGRGRARTQHKG